MSKISYGGYRFPPKIIQQTIWLYLRFTLTRDIPKGMDPQRISFEVGEDAKAAEFDKFKHGYAGTIYRGQGRSDLR
jgi:hypothetical protein